MVKDDNDYLARVGSIHLLRHEVREMTKTLDRATDALYRILHGTREMSGLLSHGVLKKESQAAGWKRAKELAVEVQEGVATLSDLLLDLQQAENSFKETYGKDVPK
jgi:hypothetical protein